ncbi:hypothetical protein DNTS_015042, partial [Danionella cerebrum]
MISISFSSEDSTRWNSPSRKQRALKPTQLISRNVSPWRVSLRTKDSAKPLTLSQRLVRRMSMSTVKSMNQ